MKKSPVIAVIGGSSCSESARALAQQVGYELAQSGCHLICGGRGGVMDAACLGHRQGRGDQKIVTIGLLPGSDRASANANVDVVLTSGIGFARNAIIVASAMGVIAVAGESGTLSEIALAWQFGRPIAAVGGAGGWSERLAGVTLDSKRTDEIYAASTPADSVEHILRDIETP